MNSHDTRTSPTLLGRTADWTDGAAWNEFMARYEPLIHAWCREYRLDGDFAADVSQLFWLKLVKNLRLFRYDPSLRFRGWLRRSFHWQVINALRQRKHEASSCESLDDRAFADIEASLMIFDRLGEQDDAPSARQLALFDMAQQVQASVRQKVKEQSWQIFWHIAIDGWSTRQTADSLNISYAATHVAFTRVSARLAQEGRQRLADHIPADARREPSQ